MNDDDEKKGIDKKERSLLNFAYFVACSDPQAAVDFLFRSLQKVGKEEDFLILREKIAKLLEENHYHYEAAFIRTIDKK
jgi:hypothetical protein